MPANVDRTRRSNGGQLTETASDRARPHVQRLLPALAVLLLIGMVSAQACSSDSKPSGQSNATPSGQSSATPTTAPASPVVSGIQPINPEDLNLQLVKGPIDAYEVRVPAGWVIEDFGAIARRYVLMENGAKVVQIAVRCEEGRTIEDMTTGDFNTVSGRGGRYGLPGTDVSSGALIGKQLDYSISVGGNATETRAAYLADTPCGWRVLLQGFRAGMLDRYALLFEAVLASFRPLRSGQG